MTAALHELDETIGSLDEFAELWAAHERLHTRLALAAARLETTGEYGIDGTVSMTAWLRNNCRMADTDAAALLRRGRFLTKFPPVANAALNSTLSSGHVRALQNSVTRATEVVFHEHAADQVTAIADLPVRDAEQMCTAWRQRAEAIVELPEPSVPERQLSCARASDGSLIGRFVFDPALAAEFEHALATAITWEGRDDTRTTSVRQADAMFDVFAFYNANHDKPGTPRNRPHIDITIDAERLHDSDWGATTTDGYPQPASSSDAFACDSIIQRFTMNGSVPIDIGHTSRTVPASMFRAVALRDGGCRHPGCDRNIAWCDAHHIQYWRHGGPTAIDNLILLCTRHHHLIHRPGWHTKLLPDGTWETTTPNGQTLSSQPRPTPRQRLKHFKPDRP